MRSTISAIFAITASCLLLLPASAQKGRGSGKKNKAPKGHWQRGLPYTTDIARAIATVRKSGQMLAIYVGDRAGGGQDLESKRLWNALKAVTNGRLMDRFYYDMQIDETPFADTWSSYFVWVNLYTKKVKGDVKLGPFGVRKFKFSAERNGQLLIYRYDGTRVSASARMHKDSKQRTLDVLEQLCDACTKHGPIAKPKAVEPLVEDYDKALAHRDRRRVGQAYELFAKIVEAGKDRKTFPNGAPMVATRADKRIAEIVEQGETELAGAQRAEGAARKKALSSLLSRYSRVTPLKTKIQARLDALK